MSQCCEGNNKEVLSILLGYAYSEDFVKKSLWWITRDLTNDLNKVIIVDDGKCGNIRQQLRDYETRIQYQIIKIDNNLLLQHFNIKSLKESPKLAYAICEKFAEQKRVCVSTRSICFDYSFKNFVEKISKDEVIEMKSYLIPKYIQEAIGEYSSNFCNFLALECSKYPLYEEFFPAKNDNYITRGYCNSKENKNIYFSDYKCYYFQMDDTNEVEKLENINLNLIDKIIEYS